MNWLLFANNLTSLTMVIACWWLTHLFSRLKPPGRVAAIMFAALGLTTLFIAVARNFDVAVAWPAVLSKLILSVCLILLVIRRYKMGQV